MKTIEAKNQGQTVLLKVSSTDWPLSKHKWGCCKGKYCRYIYAKGENRQTVWLHREVQTRAGKMTKPWPEEVVFFKNGDKTDCRRQNLITCHLRDAVRHKKLPTTGDSKYRGVCRKNNRWQAYIKVNGIQLHLGLHLHEESAARAYDKAANLHFKQFARLNFP